MPLIIGITGNIACGKTSVGQMLLKLGAERYIDADAIVHHLYESGQPIALEVEKVFGLQVLASDGSIDRRALGAIVFHDAVAMQRLEQIVHPAVSGALKDELVQVSDRGIVVLDAVKLLEGGSGALCQSKWLVTCPKEQELQRLMERNHLSQEEAEARILVQPDISKKLAFVDEVIDNGGSVDQTYRQVKAAFDRFCEKYS